MSIQSEISRITGEVNAQTSALASIESQLAQALTLLDGKAAGGGSGGSIETCEVTVTVNEDFSGLHLTGLIYTSIEDGKIVSKRTVVNDDFELISSSKIYKGVISCVVGTKILVEDLNTLFLSNPIFSPNLVLENEMWGAWEDMPVITVVSGATGQITA